MKPFYRKPIIVAIAITGVILAGFITYKLNSIINEPTNIPKRPNLFLITLDTLRPDHLNIYGYKRDTSPAIYDLSKDSFVFNNAFTVATNSAPSHATIMTGLYPLQHGLIDNGQAIHPNIPTLASHLKERGYETAGFVGYHALNEESGLDKGFDDFEFIPIASHDHDLKEIEDDFQGFFAVNSWLESWIKKKDKSAFFLWMHVQNIHESYDPPPPYNTLYKKISISQVVEGFDGEFDVRCANDLSKAWRGGFFPASLKEDILALYDGEIRFVDDQLKKIFDFLKSSKIYDETVIVVLSDHGEILFEVYENEFFKKGPGHTARYTDPAIRVPLIIKPAKVIQDDSGSQHNALVSTIDLAPTLLEMLGMKPAPWMSGESLVPILKREKNIDSKVFFQESPYGTEFIGVRDKNWKLIIKIKEGLESKLLTDLENDPKENLNALAENSHQVHKLERMLESWKQKNKSRNLTKVRKMSEKMRQALVKGGYIRDKNLQ